MTIKEAEQHLFDEWKRERHYPYFIEDGVFDETVWQTQPYKVLFVLKEANWENGNADMCAFLLSEVSPTYWTTWNNIARWSKAILEGGDYPRYVSKSDKTYWLRRIAAMNLKKVGGDAVAENETIYSYGQQDRVYLKRQIELYTPDLIICCGRGVGKNADILHDVVFAPEEVSEWKEPILQYNYFLASIKDKVNVPVLSFYHPQMRGGHNLFEKRYDEIKFVAQELRKKYIC